MVEKKSKGFTLTPKFGVTLRSKGGFTLIELLIVIAIIIILAAIVFVALNPLQRFQQARNAKRWADITAVLNAVKIDQVDNGGAYLSTITALINGNYHEIGTCASGASCTDQAVEASCVDLNPVLDGLVKDGYLGSLPIDSQIGTAVQTGYYLMKSATGIITVGACEAEAGATISASR